MMQAAAILERRPGEALPAQATAPAEDSPYRRFFELPLNRWQLFDSPSLRGAKIVLGHDLNPIIDFFNADDVGIGGRNAKQTALELSLSPSDEKRLDALLRLRSYDVYSLRAALGAHLSPETFEKLVLPEGEKRTLEEHTRDYTRALFSLIFEDSGAEACDRQAMRDLLEGSSRDIVQNNIMTLAQKFAIQPIELVNYIAGLGEMLLAITFFRRAFESNRPNLQRLLKEIRSIADNQFLRSRHPELLPNVEKMVSYGVRTLKLMESYFASFNGIGKIWENITPERFRKIRETIEKQYPIIGATLCIWQVKINMWDRRFHRPNRQASDNSQVQFATFFTEQIFPDFGKIAAYLDRVQQFEKVTAL